MKRAIDWKLASFQVVAILSAIMFAICSVRLFHHQSSDSFIPFWGYLASVRLAIPPILVLFFSYIIVFVGGNNFGEAPKVIIKFLKNRFFQDHRMMVCVTAALAACSTGFLMYTERHPSPGYSEFVEAMLGGEADRHSLVKNQLAKIERQNPVLAERLVMAVRVFEERSKINFTNAAVDSTIPRILVRSLETKISDATWKSHPIRLLALAEAYSMWAQAEKASPLRRTDAQWKELLDESLSLNKTVANMDGSAMHPLIKFSAINNSGNAQYYVGNLVEAQHYYDMALLKNKNLASAGNLIAVLVLQNKLNEAIALAESTRQWAFDAGKAFSEGSQFSSVLVNGAYAHMIRGDFSMASEYLSEAYAMENDDLNALNLSLAAMLEGDHSTAEIVLGRFKYPELSVSDQMKRVMENYDPCFYLVKAMLIPENDTVNAGAHYYTYMKVARTESQLRDISFSSLSKLKQEAYQHLSNDKTSCGSFAIIPALRERLLIGAKKAGHPASDIN